LQGDLKTSAALHMMNCWDTEVRAAAPGYLTNRKGKSGDFLPDLDDLANREGMPEKGKLIFTNLCTTCHQINGEGVAFGPDLSQIGDKLSPKSIYSSIIYPSAGINFGYEGYVIKTADGSVYSGYITSQNDRELNLRMMGGITQTIAKSAVSSLEPMESSLMTPNLYELMEVQDLVDLVAYLSTLKKEEEIR
ncbi:MAG TPA: c-type cytochrome, partial [Flavilitoribacter sp.]|nr:c-type cytochrome [Flavilitoribacter sp.]